MYVGLNSSPNWSALCLIKPISKVALCATRTVSFTKSKTFGKTLSIVSASLTISFVIFVTSTTLCGISFSGFTKHSNSPSLSPFLTFIIPNSVILSVFFESPVVSISKTEYVTSFNN